MNNIYQILQTSFLQNGFCSDTECMMYNQPFSIDFLRCPVCKEPQRLPLIFTPTLKNENSKNVYKRYFSKSFVKLFINDIQVGDAIGNTSLTKNKTISSWIGIENLYLKNEQENPSGSFKDRGTFTAALLLKSKLKKDIFTFGTVSTGNMAISTAFITNLINKNSNNKINSFIIVSRKTPEEKIQAIIHAAGQTGSLIFVVNGDYSLFHEKIYELCLFLQSQGKSVHAQLTDDVFRIIGYATLFGEIIEQVKDTPDIIILPVASGALFRVAEWTLQAFLKEKSIKKIPKIILVQEKGGDPIVQAYENNKQKVSQIKLKENLIAGGINVSYSRSGNPVLHLLQQNYLDAVSVSTVEISQTQDMLQKEKIYVEHASATSVAAAKKLRKEGYISLEERVVCVLTGGDINHRSLGNKENSTIISSSISTLKEDFIKAFSESRRSEEEALQYYV